MDYFGAMRRAVTRTGLPIELKRVDLMEGDYEISQRLMDAIREADVLLADFTLSFASLLRVGLCERPEQTCYPNCSQRHTP